MGVRHALFPEPALGAPSRGCRLPDAILHGKRSYRPRSRAVRRLPAMRILSEAFQLASAGGCATGLQTRSRHAYDFIRVLTTGSGSATAFDGAFARGHGSRLFSLKLPFISQSSGVVFNIAGAWKFFTEPAEFPCSSRCVRSFCPPFGVFRWAVLILFNPARVVHTVLMHSSNYPPSG
jgi:hypothetical protein